VTAAEDQQLPEYYRDGRFEPVAGYGIAYTTAHGQSTPQDWCRPGTENTWCEFA